MRKTDIPMAKGEKRWSKEPSFIKTLHRKLKFELNEPNLKFWMKMGAAESAGG